jgi:hypothetical protein
LASANLVVTGIFYTDLFQQFAYKLLFYREINVLGEQARRARYV